MIAQCLYQSDPKNLASMGRQRLACQRAARKLQWGVQKERISETNEPVPLLMRPAVKEILQDADIKIGMNILIDIYNDERPLMLITGEQMSFFGKLHCPFAFDILS